jgi:hypothetical protein
MSAESLEEVESGEAVISAENFAFNLQTPSLMPQYFNAHYSCESASRLLFLSLHWARNIPVFKSQR